MKTILVTGSSRGIGRGTAIELAKAGHSVAIHYGKNKEAAEETRAKCNTYKVTPVQQFHIFQADMEIAQDREALIQQVISTMDGLDGVVNNAGVAPSQRVDILDMEEKSLDRLISINLKGAIHISQLASRYWLSLPKEQRGFKTLIFITSVSAEMASINRGEYCITKSGLSMTAKLFAYRLASEHIGVYELRPGIIETDMTKQVSTAYSEQIRNGLVPCKRWGQPKDIGVAVTALVAEQFAFATGSIISIDGGLNIPTL